MKDRLPNVNYKIYPIKGNKYSWKPNERPVLQVVKSNMYFGMSRNRKNVEHQLKAVKTTMKIRIGSVTLS